MANPTGSPETKSSGAFQAAAERLDRLAQGVKDQQLSDTRSGPRAARPESFVASPQEVWARQFMTQSIGPAAPRAAFAPVPSYVPLAQAPAIAPDAGPSFVRSEARARQPEKGADKGRESGHMIGMTLGKPLKKRSWIGRLLLGR